LKKIAASGLIHEQYWVDGDWNSLCLGLKEVEAVHAIKNVISLLEVCCVDLIGSQYGID